MKRAGLLLLYACSSWAPLPAPAKPPSTPTFSARVTIRGVGWTDIVVDGPAELSRAKCDKLVDSSLASAPGKSGVRHPCGPQSLPALTSTGALLIESSVSTTPQTHARVDKIIEFSTLADCEAAREKVPAATGVTLTCAN